MQILIIRLGKFHVHKNLPIIEMADEKIESYPETVQGHYSGKVRGNWAAVDESGWVAAKTALFESLHNEPGVAYVVVEDHQLQIQPHGKKYRYNGKFTKEVLSEQAHTSHDIWGRFKSWQGTRYYKFTFEVEVSTI